MSDHNFAMVFPGQGSQAVAMLADFADEAIIKETFNQASDLLNYDLWKLVSEGPAESLNQTDKTQPALLTASTALWRLWQSRTEARPNYLVGHSLGEFSALVAAGAMAFDQAVLLVEKRGLFMQQAVPAGVGKMAAILGLTDELVVEACSEVGGDEVVSPVNYNSPGQVVIAGHLKAVEAAMEICKAKGAKRALPLPVSVPSHCALMKPAASALSAELAKIEVKEPSIPVIPVINNVDVATAESSHGVKDALVRQLYSPVRWNESMQRLAEHGISDLLECGPGNVLTGLAKRIDKRLVAKSLSKAASFEAAIEKYN